MTSYTSLGTKNVNILSLNRLHIITFYTMSILCYPIHVNLKKYPVTYIKSCMTLTGYECRDVTGGA